jgi:DNA polymerase III delta prime subunit
MIYDSLLIHNKIWNNLLNSVNSNRLPHALLFHGNDGSGKEAHAIELAALINCESCSYNNRPIVISAKIRRDVSDKHHRVSSIADPHNV